MMIKIFFLYLSFTLFSCETQQSIDSYLTSLHAKGQLNGNVLIKKKGITLYEKSFGFTNSERNVPLTSDYRFNIGSIYKEFPAVVIMKLNEENLLQLDDKLIQYIPELPIWAEKISIKQALTYSSGLPKIDWNSYFSKGIQVNDSLLFEEIKQLKQLEFEHGTDYLYSNSNPFLLIKVIEKITQTDFFTYVKNQVFTPANMNNTLFKEEYPYADTSFMAIPFNADFKVDDYQIAVKNLLLCSTTEDLASWFEYLGKFELITKQSTQILSEKAKNEAAVQSPLGHCEWKNEEIQEHAHHGTTANYECLARRFEQEELTIVILTNQNNRNVFSISEKIYDLIQQNNSIN